MRDADGEIVGWVGALTDIQQLIECRERPSEKASADQAGTPLSGLTGEQIRAGRALCRLEQAQLARCAGVSLETIKRLEGFRGPVEATTRTIAALIRAFEAVGVVFDLRSGSGPGVRLAGPQAQRNNPRWEKL
jgi:DNA-binding XRE family transcriptional regulator